MSEESRGRKQRVHQTKYLWVRLLALIGLGISGYLLYLKLNGTTSAIPGCGGAEGCCQTVLGSRWSHWLYLPVSALSSALYLGVLGMSLARARKGLTIAAFLLLGAALWFMSLQLFATKCFCPWCLAIHVTGMLTALAILVALKSFSFRTLWKSIAYALVPLTLLIAGQLLGPRLDTHSLDDDLAKGPNSTIHFRDGSRIVTFGEAGSTDGKKFAVDQLPILGSRNAEHIMVEYYDYSCNTCGNLHDDLKKLLAKHPKKIAILLLPTPLHRRCNEHMRVRIPDHDHACELARLSLAVWRTHPELFPKVHDLLFTRPVLNPDLAMAEIIKLLPQEDSESLEAALSDPWIDELISANTRDFKTLTARSTRMPKVLVTDTQVYQGVSRTTEIFMKTIEGALKIPTE